MKNAGVESVEDLMEKVFTSIKSNSKKEKNDKKRYKPEFTDKTRTVVKTKKGTYNRDVKLTKEQRDQNLQNKIETVKEQIRKLESA